MQKLNRNTWILLITLTATTAILANVKLAAFFVIGIAVIKILLVAFQFMDLKNAHLFWGTILTSLILLFASIILILLF